MSAFCCAAALWLFGSVAVANEPEAAAALYMAPASSLIGEEPPPVVLAGPVFTSGSFVQPVSWFTEPFWDEDQDALELCPACDDCRRRSIVAFVGFDSWRGVADGNGQNNGVSSGVNFGTRLGPISDWTGIGFQLGGSAAAYNWSGNATHLTGQDEAQPQGFVTYGIFRKAHDETRWSASLVHDWMFNSNFGVVSSNPTLAQCRGQIGYAINARNEIGVWGTWRTLSDTRTVSGLGSVTWRPVNQLNAYWHHKWGVGGADTWFWVGVPDDARIGSGGGSLGDFLSGLYANCPLSDRLSLYSMIAYMHPSAAAGPLASQEVAWNFSIGLMFYPARNARTITVAGQCWSPQLPVANNGYFLVDSSQ